MVVEYFRKQDNTFTRTKNKNNIQNEEKIKICYFFLFAQNECRKKTLSLYKLIAFKAF